MADEAEAGMTGGSGAAAGHSGGAASHGISTATDHLDPKTTTHFTHHYNAASSRKSTFEYMVESGVATPMPNNKRQSKIDLEDYFAGPRDMDRHSKLPYFMRMHGSVLPSMILPLFWITCWAVLITCISKFLHDLGVSTLLLTVLGFVVGLALSFRSTSAYERYSDGRKAWATLSVQSRNLARYIWVHIDERCDSEFEKDDLLGKISAINMVLAFAVALKHKLRFEPYAHYDDIASLIGHLETFAKDAHTPEVEEAHKYGTAKTVGNYLGLAFTQSNPRKVLKRAQRPLGNLPLEILTHLSTYIEEMANNGTLKSPVVLGQILTSMAALVDTMAAAERVLTTPLPIGYNILISQVVLLYVYLLPFQLYGQLGWVTIPGTIAAAYIILGLHAIGNELENPFGNDVNDLPLDFYCEELRKEFDILTSRELIKAKNLITKENKVMWPLSLNGAADWRNRNVHDIRAALKAKVVITPNRKISLGDSSLGGSEKGTEAA
ncbi:Bestrophin, RFP-TM, chloride channel-domain-containing protein [Calycina marina]|uniref:Bestrophin, RFP-TM, chloride channel-domain-containing protein n=1 Tax=Calycina marina TaxID=1763456 RepID=A0A9P8CD54_9HELO|nr:Bestrophin, RFP-TM, chloride channel-domain-containing protein [Calycina marina]